MLNGYRPTIVQVASIGLGGIEIPGSGMARAAILALQSDWEELKCGEELVCPPAPGGFNRTGRN